MCEKEMKNATKRKLTSGNGSKNNFSSSSSSKLIQNEVATEKMSELDDNEADDADVSSDEILLKRSKKDQDERSSGPINDNSNEIVIGDVVFARLSSRAPWWPAVVIDPRMCGYQVNGKAWVFWLGDNRISDVDPTQVRTLSEGFSYCFRMGGTQNYVSSVHKAIELYATRNGLPCPDNPLEWACGQFPSRKNSSKCRPCKPTTSQSSLNGFITEGLLPDFITDRLRAIKRQQVKKTVDDSFDDVNGLCPMKLDESLEDEDENSDSSTSASNGGSDEQKERPRLADAEREARRSAICKLSLNEFCICCGTVDSLKVDHPLVVGRMCKNCTTCYKEICFVYDQDNKKEHCSICGGGGDLFICDNSNCANVFCQVCVSDLDSKQSLQKIVESDPWFCYVCTSNTSGNIRPRKDWENRLFALFKTTNVLDDLDLSLIPSEKKPVRVLSLFDGVGTAKIVLDELGLDIDAYYCSEIDPEALLVTKVNHSNEIIYLGDVREVDLEKLKEIGPIDIVIGGSPCNDISIANPKRKGLYDPTGTGILFFEYYRILQTVLQLNNRQNRNTFWLYENVASMRMEYRSVIDRFLGRVPALYDSCHFSAQNRARYFWGNIPGMYSSVAPTSSQPSPRVSDILVQHCGRVAKMDKVRTVTTRTNSLKQGRQFSVCPVEMDGKPDTLWPTELETLFGLPRHYTDVGSLSPTKRQKLIGQGWTVPVVKHILRPLQRFFKTKDIK